MKRNNNGNPSCGATAADTLFVASPAGKAAGGAADGYMRLGARLVAGALALLAAGCGGGGDAAPGTTPAINSAGPSGTGGTTPATAGIDVALALKQADGAAAGTNPTLSLAKPLSLAASVMDKSGKPVANALLTVSVDGQLITMTPSGQLATDASGKATVTLAPAGITRSGASSVTVLVQVGQYGARADAVVTVAQPVLSVRQVAPALNPAPLAANGDMLVALEVLGDGALLSNLPVTLNLASTCAEAGRATLPPSVTTVQGRAQFTYKDKGCAQTDAIVATLDGAASVGARVGVTVASADAASVVFGSVLPADSSIVIQGAGGNGRTETAQVRFRVLDKNGAPLANQNVAFSTISTKAVRLSQASGVTDGNGEVVANLVSGPEPTAVRVMAKLANGLSTVSDTITVTTGLPVQLAFSLSAKEFNIEGWEYDDVTDEIKLLLADQFSNPVANGVPVVAQTDSGAIGSSARGGCVTDNGRCTIDLRSQNPRYGSDATAPRGRAGLATISLTTLAGEGAPLGGQTAVFLSGSRVGNVTLVNPVVGVKVEGSVVTVDTNQCGAVNVALRLSDARRNPMPARSTLTFDSAVRLTGSAYPTAVPSVAPVYDNGVVSGDQGSVHTVALVPDTSTCEPNGPVQKTGSANLVLTTPLNNATLLPIVMHFNGKLEAGAK